MDLSSSTISKVSVWQDGNCMASDTHAGSTCTQNTNPSYRLDVKNFQSGHSVTLVMEVEAKSSSDTSGTIEVRRKEELSTKP